MKVYLVYELSNIYQHELIEAWATERDAQRWVDACNRRDYPGQDPESDDFGGWVWREVMVQGTVPGFLAPATGEEKEG